MSEKQIVVAGIVQYKNKVLLLRRSEKMKNSPNKWCFVTGIVRKGETLEKAVLREIKEETGLKGNIVGSGKAFEVNDKWGDWLINPFLVSVTKSKVELDQTENIIFEWILPQEIDNYNCVVDIKKDLMNLNLL